SYSATLEWTAPAGDWELYLSTEGVTRYILRYSTEAPIETYEDFLNATEYSQNWFPQPRKSTERHDVDGLDSDTTYYFVMESQNQHALRSERSFNASTTTLPSTLPPLNPFIEAVYQSSITVSWGGVAPDSYLLEASTGQFPNKFAGNKSSATPDSELLTLTVTELLSNTTYYLWAGALWFGTTDYALTTPASTSTLAVPVEEARALEVFLTSATIRWNALPPFPQHETAEGYLLEASTAP
ncbi:unnamed protein product, partial [marine sediment metagenome]